MGWEEDYRQSQILDQTRNIAQSLKNIEDEQYRQRMKELSVSSGGGGGIPLPSGKTILKIIGVMLVCGAVLFPGTIIVMLILGIVLSEIDALSGCNLVVDMPDYQVISTAIAFILGFVLFVLLVRAVKRMG